MKYERQSESSLDIKKPIRPDICVNKELKDYISQRSWQIFQYTRTRRTRPSLVKMKDMVPIKNLNHIFQSSHEP